MLNNGKVFLPDILDVSCTVQFLDQSAIQFCAAPANLVQESQFPPNENRHHAVAAALVEAATGW